MRSIKPILLAVISSTALVAGAKAQASTEGEQGLASWYGEPFHGQRAASGEIYDMEQLTAAHRTLPFGTTVRVRRLDSGASVIVRINDRGPDVESRIIDLSLAAARKLGLVEPGVAPVTVQVVEAVEALLVSEKAVIISSKAAAFAVQVGTFRVFDNALRTRAAMEQQYGAARIVVHHRDGDLWSVLAGQCTSRAEAESLAGEIRTHAKGMESAYVVQIEPGAFAEAD
jgi:rare lipoprotein A